MKLIIVFIALIFTISHETNAQDSPIFTLGTATTINQTAIIPITAKGFSNIASGNLKVTYDPAVAVPVAVTRGAGLTGTFACNLGDTGIVRIGWFTYPPVSLDDGSVLFYIRFNKVSSGFSMISFDDGTMSPIDCQFTNGSHKKLNDIPFNSYYLSGSLTFNDPEGPVTTAPVLTAHPGENIAVPITVKAFNNVGGVSLILEYDPGVLDFISAENTGGFPGLIVSNPYPGTITTSGTLNDPEGYSLPGETVFFTLNFLYLGGSTTLCWNDNDGSSCKYFGPQPGTVFPDTPQHEYYLDGKVEQNLAPQAPDVRLIQPTCSVATGKIEVTSPLGEAYTYSIDGTEYQSSPVFRDLFTGTYNVTVLNKEGHVSPETTAVIKKQPYTPVTPAVEITAPTCESGSNLSITNYNPSYAYSFFPQGPITEEGGKITGLTTGQFYTLTVISSEGCESSTSEPFLAEERLEAPQPIIATEQNSDGKIILTAQGESFLWSTGETTPGIVATATGEYWVEVTYANGCSAVSAPVSIIISSSPLIESGNNQVQLKAYPNPFSEWLRIEFIAPEAAHGCLDIYDTNGRLVKRLLDDDLEAGSIYTKEFIPTKLSGNIYCYTLKIGKRSYSGIFVHIGNK